ncbi:MAG TPA: AI-2E family transporter, partial [Prosthecobacter sp.]|nr:AI-2E family transporter [Prosthecobacter sp.]
MGTEETSPSPIGWGHKSSQMIVTLACLVVVLAGMKAAAGILVPMAYAFFLAVLSFPLLRWLTRHRVPGPVALGVTLLMNLSVLAGLITLAVRLLISFNKDLPSYLRGLQRYLSDFGGWLEAHKIEGAKATLDSFFDWNTIFSYASQQDVMTRIGSMLGSTFGTLATIFAGLVMILILMMFVLMEAPGTHSRLIRVRMAGGP